MGEHETLTEVSEELETAVEETAADETVEVETEFTEYTEVVGSAFTEERAQMLDTFLHFGIMAIVLLFIVVAFKAVHGLFKIFF